MSSHRLIRTFFDLNEENVDDAESIALMRRYGFGTRAGWDEILKSRLILLLSEAQSGKTYECQAQCREMWEVGQAAFYVELASVAAQRWSDLRTDEENQRLDRWRRTEAEIATIFLDSVDELNLTQGSFATALRNVANDLQGQIGRVRVVLTSRPLPVDRALFERTFAVPPAKANFDENDFAAVARGKKRDEKSADAPPEKRYVSLLPLSVEDIAGIAATKEVTDTQAFIAGLRQSSMLDFMRRPQDVIEAAAAWRELDGHFGTHAQHEAFDVKARLKSNPERNDRPLSEDRAMDGAQRLALAVVLTQRLTIRHDVNRDVGDPATTLNPGTILHDWNDDDRKALLERGLFGFASYGRVRFHNRLAFEFLAAQRLAALIDRGLSRRAVRRLLVIETAQGFEVIRPSLQDVAAWLALRQPWVFDLVLDLDPALLMNLGDPGSLSMVQRQKVLTVYIERFGKGGWRGLSVPQIQINRIADQSLGPIVQKHFPSIENPEVKQTLLDLIAHAKLSDCARIARDVVWAEGVNRYVRSDALDALIALDDPELATIAAKASEGPGSWGHSFARLIIYRMFPGRMSVEQFLTMLAWVKETKSTGSELSRNLPSLIEKLDVADLRALRAGLKPLVDAGCRFNADHHTVANDRPHLVHLLAAVCAGLVSAGVLDADDADCVALSAKLARDMRSDERMPTRLGEAIETATAAMRAAIFVADVELTRRLRSTKDRLDLFSDLLWTGALRPEQSDEPWMRPLLDATATSDLRAAALLIEIHRYSSFSDDRRAYLEALRPLVADDSELVGHLEKFLRPGDPSRQQRKWAICDLRRTRRQERREAKAKASWIDFWRELKDEPEKAFAADRSDNTAWNLYRVMRNNGAQSRSSGWDRKLIEDHLGKDVADRFRTAMLPIWRRETPLLQPERSAESRSTHWEQWTLALVAIAAEAEDPNWVSGLQPHEIEQAVRYATLNMSNFPAWLGALVAAHPDVVERVIGKDISWSLSQPASAQGYSMVLQDVEISDAEIARIFLPRIRNWLASTGGLPGDRDDVNGAAQRMDQAISIMLKFGDEEDAEFLRALASAALVRGANEPFLHIWMPTLFALDPEAAVARLEALCHGVPVSRESHAVAWIARLFGRARQGRGVSIKRAGLTPDQIMRLLRLAYTHVAVGEDAVHEGSYEPDIRDDAEDGRNALLNALLELEGPAGWAAKQEIAKDPMFAHFRDRLHVLASEKSAREADKLAMRPEELVKFDTNNEPGPRTSAEMFALMTDRIDDIRQTMLEDPSPRELWASTRIERVIRRAIADHLTTHARGAYTVAQESVTADEKETDIRLRSTTNAIEGVIELKIGDSTGYSGASLKATLTEQLLDKYLAPEGRRAGILLITRAEREGWDDPATGNRLDFPGLMKMLKEEASRIEANYPDEMHIGAEGLELKPRLGTERPATTKASASSKCGPRKARKAE